MEIEWVDVNLAFTDLLPESASPRNAHDTCKGFLEDSIALMQIIK